MTASKMINLGIKLTKLIQDLFTETYIPLLTEIE